MTATSDAVTALREAPVALVAFEPGTATVAAGTDAFARLVGQGAEALAGLDLATVVAPWDRATLTDLVAPAPATPPGPDAPPPDPSARLGGRTADGRPFSIELTRPDAAGLARADHAGHRTYWASTHAEPAVAGPVPRGVDSALSHDVRGALRSVKSFLELVDRSEALAADEKAARFLGIARNAGNDADVMVERLVQWLRLRERPFAVDRVALEPLVRDAVVGMADEVPETRSPHLELVDAAAFPAVVGNGELVTTCIEELLINAHKFGGPDVRITVTATALDGTALEGSPGDGWVEVRVGDDAGGGEGIDPALAPEAFRLYRLLQPKGQHPGVGMGLPVARTIAEAHGGTLHLERRAGGGTDAVLRLLGA